MEKGKQRMILVDIQVPAVSEIYDFELDESVPAGDLISQIAALAAGREGMKWSCNEKLYLYSLGHGGILDDSLPLKNQGVKSGERLILF